MQRYQAGYIKGIFSDDNRQDWDDKQPRPVSWSCWYPAPFDNPTIDLKFGHRTGSNLPLFSQGQVAEKAPISDSQDEWPLVVFSHGTGGTSTGLAWLGTRLAQTGYICIGVDHHGNTAIEPYRAEGFICWWERASDLSFIIDHANDIAAIKNRVDSRNISVVGFSLGGYTALSLTGAVTSMAQFEAWLLASPNPTHGPREFPNIDQEIPLLMAKSPRFRQSWDRHGDLYLDTRISKCVAIAPAPPVRAFLTDSLSSIACPTFIISGEADNEAPYEQCSVWLSKQNPGFRLQSAGKDVGHYTFLSECTHHGKSVEQEICIDHPHIIRSEIHDEVSSKIVDFLRKNQDTHRKNQDTHNL
ncbi:MAG: alpha/beta fold hydrolase [Gammaproteobacteria bacterium]|nr:alpha/beta fold hydrolase [Gammaproteobacteria bacterium]